jgi:hypothetical protein
VHRRSNRFSSASLRVCRKFIASQGCPLRRCGQALLRLGCAGTTSPELARRRGFSANSQDAADKPLCDWAALLPAPPGWLAAEGFQQTPQSALGSGPFVRLLACAIAWDRASLAVSVSVSMAAWAPGRCAAGWGQRGRVQKAGEKTQPPVHPDCTGSAPCRRLDWLLSHRAPPRTLAAWFSRLPMGCRDYPVHSAADQPREAGSLRNLCNREFPADSARPCRACWVIKWAVVWGTPLETPATAPVGAPEIPVGPKGGPIHQQPVS